MSSCLTHSNLNNFGGKSPTYLNSRGSIDNSYQNLEAMTIKHIFLGIADLLNLIELNVFLWDVELENYDTKMIFEIISKLVSLRKLKFIHKNSSD